MTEEEKKKYTQKTSYNAGSTSSYTGTYVHEPAKEKSLRITVKGTAQDSLPDDGNLDSS